MLYSKNVIAVPPGETIREQLEIRGMSQREFAQRRFSSDDARCKLRKLYPSYLLISNLVDY